MMRRAFDAVHWYMAEVGSHVVAKTGIPSDRHHIGKLVLHSLQDDPDFVMQIDGGTGKSETYGSVLDRSIRCAVSLTNLGLKKGDVMVLMGPNHIDFCIPHYAALYLGIMIASIDDTLGAHELKELFHTNQPNIIFCQSEKTADIQKALEMSKVNAKIVTFNNDSKHTTLADLLENEDEKLINFFKPTDLDPVDTVAYLTSTSGTTGVPKTAMLTHKNLTIVTPYMWRGFSKFPTPTKLVILTSPAQWLSAGLHYLFSPILKYTRLQTSSPLTPEHFAELVNKYKPTYIATSPTMMTTMMTSAKCDFTCFETILLGGSAVTQDVIDEAKQISKMDDVYMVYGLSELSGLVVQPDFTSAPGSCGRPISGVEIKLVDPETNKDITEPNVLGEAWFRGPTLFKGYHNNPEVTKETLTEDGWLKSGDIFYRDHSWNMFFVERYKLLLKYRNHQVSPVEIETVIMRHPGVFHVAVTGIPDRECGDLDVAIGVVSPVEIETVIMRHPGVFHVAVTGIPDRECGDLVVACVVPKPGCSPTAQEIKDLVKEKLTDSKLLRGGVIFMKELPETSTSKIHRKKLKELVLTMPRE